MTELISHGTEAASAGMPDAQLTEHAVSVLLVDDQQMIGEAVRRMLAPHDDIRYAFCDDPTRALDVARDFKPTVVLSDLVMPQMDGLELVRRLRADTSLGRVPLIVLSSTEDASTKADAFSAGANDYIVKLPDVVELVARIRYHSTGYIHMLQRDEAFDALARSQEILKDDLAQAAGYVTSLLPEPIDEGVVRARWAFTPSASLGGDAFGYQWMDDDHFVVYLLDVSGHGVGAALLSVSVLNLLNARSLPKTDFRRPGQVIRGLNQAFRMSQQGGRYFTIWYGVYQPSTRTFRYAGGAHPPALLFSDDGEVRRLPSTGTIPGILPDVRYTSEQVTVPAGSRLLVFSDGLYELPIGEDRVATYDALFEALSEPGDDTPPLERATRRARTLIVTEGFPDDVSAVELRIE